MKKRVIFDHYQKYFSFSRRFGDHFAFGCKPKYRVTAEYVAHVNKIREYGDVDGSISEFCTVSSKFLVALKVAEISSAKVVDFASLCAQEREQLEFWASYESESFSFF